jgi:hypothetical protein
VDRELEAVMETIFSALKSVRPTRRADARHPPLLGEG